MKIYYEQGKLKIRSMLESDAQAIIEVFQSYGWNNKIETYSGYFKDQEVGTRSVYVAEYDSEIAGYGTLLFPLRVDRGKKKANQKYQI